MTEVQTGATVLGGRYLAEVSGELGARYIGGTAGDFAGTAGQVGGYFALKKLVKGPTGRMLRLGLLSEMLHELLVVHAGVDLPAKVVDMLPEGVKEEPKPSPEEAGEAAPTTTTAGLARRGAAEMLGQYSQEDQYDIDTW